MGGAVQQIGVVTAAVAASFIPGVGPFAAAGVLIAGGTLLGRDAETPGALSLDPASPSRGILLNKASNNAPIPIVYGTRRVGGTRVFLEVTGSGNEYLHVVLALCEGEIQAVDTVYLDDAPTTDSRFSGLVDVYAHLGADDQAADSNLVSAVTNWTNDHRLRGTAYVYLRLKWNSNAFGGLPTITCDVSGKKVYDPRDETTKFSANPALCIRDYLVNARYGRGIPESMIDDESFKAAANYCDEDVTVAGNVQDRYTCDGVVDTDKSSLEIVREMLTSCRGALIFSGGLYRLKIDKPDSAAFTFDEDNIVGAWGLSLGDKKNTLNRIRANYFNPDRSWQPDIVPVDSSTYRTQDNGVLLEREIELPFTANFGTAKQIATINLKQSRQQIACEFTATVKALQCEVFDVVYITHATPGWSEKKFRILALSLQNNDEVRVTALEYDEDVYDFGTISAPDDIPDTNLPDPFSVQPPSNLAVEEKLYSIMEGTGVASKAVLSCAASGDAFVTGYQFEYRLSGAGSYTIAGTSGVPEMEIPNMGTGLYEFRVKALNTMGASSTYADTQEEFHGLTANPSDVSGLYLQVINGVVHLSWDQVGDLDVKIGGRIRVRHTPATTGQLWSSGTDIGPAVSGVATSVVLPLLSGTYMVKAVDSLGNESENAVMAVTCVPDIVTMNVVETSDQDPDFTGEKTNMAVSDGKLMFDEMGSETTGEYEFDAPIDLGSVCTSRVTSNLSFYADQTTDLVDSRAGNVDDWAVWDYFGDFSDVAASLYVATTDDDPSGSPAWSEWMKFAVGDYTARAFKFKLTAESSDVTHQIHVIGLSVSVDMPDRMQGSQDVSVASGGSNITYPTAFRAVPDLGVTVVNMATGDYLIVTSESETGFTAQVKNSGGTGVARTINWLARGYY